ncbi:hypothetical protein CDAR_265271 [Caerostris darwini]|uniref:Uncharacterized protein n=1 Tax=Caerostris darwini TaxID=1538125 RepID=A0AAV4W4Y5_9ARAC|nr:hypothetical protein CDAR_265271 [Caerostris darwini]
MPLPLIKEGVHKQGSWLPAFDVMTDILRPMKIFHEDKYGKVDNEGVHKLHKQGSRLYTFDVMTDILRLMKIFDEDKYGRVDILGKSKTRRINPGQEKKNQENPSPDQAKINHENFSQDIRLSIQDILSLSSPKAMDFRSSDSSSSFQ